MMSSGSRTYRVAIIEDHLLQRQREVDLVSAQPDLTVVFSGDSAPAFIEWIRQTDESEWPHLLLLDLLIERAPSVDVTLVKALLDAGLRIVVISALASAPLVRQIVKAGVQAVVSKRDSEEDILLAMRAALTGEQWMTSELASVIAGDPKRPQLSIQEERALVLYASGLQLAEVAVAMNIRPTTAKQYIDRVKSKYTTAGAVARTRLDLGRIAWTDGYLDPNA